MSWNQQNINLLIDNVSKNPTNLGYAFNLTANAIGKNKDTVSKWYYNNIRKKQAVISVATKHGYSVNTKNSPIVKDTTIELRMEIMKDILTKMSPKERKEVVKLILNL
jgi:hypothetical protein